MSSLSNSTQLDWCSLVKGALGIGARIAKAGIDPVTVEIGILICSSFDFPPDGQKDLETSLNALQGCSSWGKAIYLGFGIEHVVKTLSNREGGAACVAISAALAVQYHHSHAANVIRALCRIQDVPDLFAPSRLQWESLVKICENCLSRSMFPHYFNIFRRLLEPEPKRTREPTDPQIMAKALAMLGEISKRDRSEGSNLIIAGGVECAWLAAVAQVFLCLRIQLFGPDGRTPLFKSSTPGPVQVTFISEITHMDVGRHLTLDRQVYSVSTGREILQDKQISDVSILRSSTTWSTVLSDTFPTETHTLNRPFQKRMSQLIWSLTYHAGAYFSCSSPAAEDFDSIWWLRWNGHGCLFHPKRTGLELISHSIKLFPELSFLTSSDNLGGSKSNGEVPSLEDCVEMLSHACGCSMCWKKSTQRESPRDAIICETRLALTIARLILILAPVTVHESVPPCVQALRRLYISTAPSNPGSSSPDIPCHGIHLVLYLFTGEIQSPAHSPRISAASARGVCVFLSLLRNPNLPPNEAMTIEIVPGHIRHGYQYYNCVTDIPAAFRGSNIDLDDDTSLSNGEVELVTQEREDTEIMTASYRIMTAENQSVYLDVAFLQEALLSSIRTVDHHPENCDPTLSRDPTLAIGHGLRRWSLNKSDRSSSNSASSRQNSLSSMESTQENSWALLKWDAWDNSGSFRFSQGLKIAIDRTDNFLISVLLSDLYMKNSNLPYYVRREKSLVAQMPDCQPCIVQLAAFAWYKCAPQKPVSSTGVVGFDDNKKHVFISKKPESKDDMKEEIQFELVPELAGRDSSMTSLFQWFSIRSTEPK
jgi:hypothetical protein